MNDGGAEIGSKHEHPNTKRKFGGDDFAQAIAKIAVAQICERVGFQTFQQSALGTLSDIAVQHIHHIGKTANFYANLAGRTEGNTFDILQGLEDLGPAQGFAGASDIDHCLASSGVVREIIKYVCEAQDSPFAYSIPRFPVVKEQNPRPSFFQIGEEPPDEHIPAWLPAFPDPQTYIQFPTENERATDTHMEKNEPAKQQRKVERSLLNLQQRFACNGQEGPSSVNHGGISKEKLAGEIQCGVEEEESSESSEKESSTRRPNNWEVDEQAPGPLCLRQASTQALEEMAQRAEGSCGERSSDYGRCRDGCFSRCITRHQQITK